jgi:dTDP-4-dehydrorhamnose 3,5-epimerase
MEVINTKFSGLNLIKNTRIEDSRGWFEKKYNGEILKGLSPNVGESYVSISKKGVLRGLHFQSGSSAQSKLVSCLSGSFIDIAVDLRKSEPTFGQVFLHEIDSRSAISLFIPGDFAHGIYALESNTIMLNYAGSLYAPGNEGGINWKSIK